MSSRLSELFQDITILNKIRAKLPYLFSLAELEASRAGRVGMEVGSLREKILIALLIYKFGQDNVDFELPITEPEADVKLFGAPISIKTITGQGRVKAVWTVDAQSARAFTHDYSPKADILLTQINWGAEGYLYFISLETQNNVLKQFGKEDYFNLPKAGTNPRGIEFSKEALLELQREATEKIKIEWERPKTEGTLYEAYRRWVDYWGEE